MLVAMRIPALALVLAVSCLAPGVVMADGAPASALWRLTLDQPRKWTRLTNFNRYRGYGASNPVVSPDGWRVAFQMSITDGAEGEGAGLFVLDLNQVP